MAEEDTIGVTGMVLLVLLPFVFHLWEDPPTSEKKVETGLKIDKRLLISKGRM